MPTFKVDTELESDYNEEQAMLAGFLAQRLPADVTYSEVLEVIQEFYKELP